MPRVMSPTSYDGGFPMDTPIVQSPGVMHREADAAANQKHYALPPEHPRRAAKGDIGSVYMKDFEPRALSHAGLPYSTLRKFRGG